RPGPISAAARPMAATQNCRPPALWLSRWEGKGGGFALSGAGRSAGRGREVQTGVGSVSESGASSDGSLDSGRKVRADSRQSDPNSGAFLDPRIPDSDSVPFRVRVRSAPNSDRPGSNLDLDTRKAGTLDGFPAFSDSDWTPDRTPDWTRTQPQADPWSSPASS